MVVLIQLHLIMSASATCDDGSCIAPVYGCTDPLALNYYAGASIDNGSCCYVSGCMDPIYTEYDALACIDDGSCAQYDIYVLVLPQRELM